MDCDDHGLEYELDVDVDLDLNPAAASKTLFAYGRIFMWHRLLVFPNPTSTVGQWEACVPNKPGHEPDSRVHRAGRAGLFANIDQAEIDKDPEAQAALEALRLGKRGPISHNERVKRQAMLERYVLERHSESKYAGFLRAIGRRVGLPGAHACEWLTGDVPDDGTSKIVFLAPAPYLISAYASCLRCDSHVEHVVEVPDHKFNTIRFNLLSIYLLPLTFTSYLFTSYLLPLTSVSASLISSSAPPSAPESFSVAAGITFFSNSPSGLAAACRYHL